MDNIFDEGADPFKATSVIDELNSYVPVKQVPPQSAIRNRAVTISLLDNGDSGLEGYQSLVRDMSEGNDISTNPTYVSALDKNKTRNLEGIMDVLSSKDYTFEQKQQAIEATRGYSILKEPSVALQTQSLAKESLGENYDQERARLSAANAIRDVAEAREQVQAIINRHAVTLGTDTGMTGLGNFLASVVMPFGNSIIQGRITKAQADKNPNSTWWDSFKGFLLPGSAASETQRKFANMPPEKAVEFAQNVINDISNNAGVIFTKENQFAQYERVQRMLNGEEPSTAETLIENLSPVLDVFGLRAEFRAGKELIISKSVSRELALLGATKNVRKEPVMAPQGVDTPSPFVGPVKPPDQSLISKAPVPDQALVTRQSQVDALVQEKSALLGDAGNLAERGDIRGLTAELSALQVPDVSKAAIKDLADQIKTGAPKISAKEARTEAAKRLNDKMLDYEASRTRIEGLIEQNRVASTNTQRVAELEKQIAELSKGLPDNVGSKVNPVTDLINRIDWNNLVKLDNPAAPASIISHSNPNSARQLFSALVKSPDDEFAKTMYGAGKTDAIAAQIFPQATTELGVVTTKTTSISKDLETPASIKDILGQKEGLDFSEAELKIAQSHIVNDFTNADGLHVNDAMGGVRFDRNGGIVSIDAVYGSSEGGWSSAQVAMDRVKYGLKKYGVKDSEIELLAQDGLTHKPVNLSDVADKEGNYLVRVKIPYEVSMRDVGSPEWLSTKRNWADHIPQFQWGNQGSLSRFMFDAASMVHPRYASAASRSVDLVSGFDKILLEEATKFTDQLASFSKDRQAAIQEYLKEANYNRIKFDPVDLTARGFTPDEVSAVKTWRDFWDTHYYLENYDVVRTLDSQGYQMFNHNGTELYAKPLHENQQYRVKRVFDPQTGNARDISTQEAKDLYTKNGYLAVLRRPEAINGENVEFMMVRNTPQEYLRKFRDSDSVLNKIDGYYTITYKGAKMVDKIERDSKGNIISRRAVAVAGDTAEAKAWTKSQSLNTNEEFKIRDDARAFYTGSDDWWDVNSAGGRIAQRFRGSLLQDAKGLNHLGDGTYVLNPVDSAVRAARSIAGRSVSRPMLENAKSRFLNQFAQYLENSKDAFGQVQFPSKVTQIGEKGNFTSKELADARTTWEYINYLENGYTNSADTAVKFMFNRVANLAGKYGLSKIERGTNRLSQTAPTSLAKNAVFNSYIASNFLRQIVVQPHQAVRTISYNPLGFISGNTTNLTSGYIEHLMGSGARSAKIDEFVKFVNESRHLDGVDKQSLVRGSLEAAVDHSNTVLKGINKAVIEYPRILGFDVGEKANRLLHLASVFDKYKREGKNLSDLRVRAEAWDKAGAISYEMNFAGDLPYNQNFAAMALQFMQVPHKALLQSTNRKLSRAERGRLLGGDLLFWGLPTGLVYNAFTEDIVPDPKMRQVLTEGAESALYNAALQKYFGTDKEIDFSSFAPYEMTGWMNIFQGIATGGFDDVLSNSPGGKLLGHNGRIQKAVRMMGRTFKGFIDPQEDDPTFWDAANEVARISSGYNNAYKAKLMLDTKQRMDDMGRITENDVQPYQAYFQVLGFGDKKMAEVYKLSRELNEWNKEQQDQLRQVYQDTKNYYTSVLGKPDTDMEHFTRVTGRLLNTYRDNPQAQEQIRKWIEQDFNGPEQALMVKLLKASGIPSTEESRRLIERSSLDDSIKQQLYNRVDAFQNVDTQED